MTLGWLYAKFLVQLSTLAENMQQAIWEYLI